MPSQMKIKFQLARQWYYSFKQSVAVAECERNVGTGLQVAKMSLFNAWYTKSTAIEEFEIAQNQTLDQAGNGLRDNWVTAVQLAFKSSFKDVGKGCWANLTSNRILSTVRQQYEIAHISSLFKYNLSYAICAVCAMQMPSTCICIALLHIQVQWYLILECKQSCV